MSRVPETRASLILRLPSREDAGAWQEFVSIYEPFVYRFARRGGLQDADARELVQDVMLSVAKAVGRWKPDKQQAKFRTWLFRIARNQLLDVLEKQRRTVAANGGSGLMQLLNSMASSHESALLQLQTDHRRELFRWAAQRVRQNVTETTWQAFWLTAVQNQSVDDVALQLNLNSGAVYIARSRVLAKLRLEVQKWEDHDAMS